MSDAGADPGTQGRRCRPRPQPREPGDLRPTDVVGAFFILGVAFLAAGAVAAVVDFVDPWIWGRWLSLHLCFVGGISSLIIGASQFFAGAFLSSDPPARRLVRAQLACWGGGSVALALAVPLRSDPAVWAAVVLLLAGLGCYVWALRGIVAASLQVIPWATRWYVSAAAFFAVGIVAGAALALGEPWTHGDLLSAHIALNVAGWLGSVIVGTLHTFYPSLTRTRAPLPALQAAAYLGWSAGVAALALGYGLSLAALATAGWLTLALGAAALLVNVIGCRRMAPSPVALPARLLGAAQLFLVAGLALAAWHAFDAGTPSLPVGAERAALGTLIVAGWIGLTVAGSLLHLLAVVLRVRSVRTAVPLPRPRADIALTALAAIGVSAVALQQAFATLRPAASIVLLAAYLLIGARVATLAGRLLIKARPAI